MNWTVENKILRLVISIVIFMLCSSIIIIRAQNISITYDEAYTYTYFVNYINLDSFYNIYDTFIRICSSIANNHLLNTFSIYLIESILNVKYVDIVIRLPNIICGLMFYLFLSYLFVEKKIGIIYYLLTTLNFYQLQFFSLARGYSMALLFNTISLYFFNQYILSKYQNKLDLSLALIFCTIGEYANSISLLLMGCYFLYIVIDFILNKKFYYKYNLFVLIVVIIMNIFITIYHFLVTKSGNPLYSSGSVTSLISDYLNNYRIGAIPILVISLIFIYLIIRNRKYKFHNLYLLLILILEITLCLFIFNKGVPSTREVIPFYSLYALALEEILIFIIGNVFYKRKISNIVIMLISVYLAFNFILNLNISTVNEVDWSKMVKIREKTYRIAIENKTVDSYEDYEKPSMDYYRNQIIYWYGVDIYQDCK